MLCVLFLRVGEVSVEARAVEHDVLLDLTVFPATALVGVEASSANAGEFRRIGHRWGYPRPTSSVECFDFLGAWRAGTQIQ